LFILFRTTEKHGLLRMQIPLVSRRQAALSQRPQATILHAEKSARPELWLETCRLWRLRGADKRRSRRMPVMPVRVCKLSHTAQRKRGMRQMPICPRKTQRPMDLSRMNSVISPQ
jgi:hypothetical protein